VLNDSTPGKEGHPGAELHSTAGEKGHTGSKLHLTPGEEGHPGAERLNTRRKRASWF